MAPNWYLGQEATKGFPEGVSHPQRPRLPPSAPLGEPALGTPVAPGDRAGRYAARGQRRDGPSHDGDIWAQGFVLSDTAHDPGLAELTRPRLYLRVVDYSGPARPQSSCRSSAAAGGAHGNAAGTLSQGSSRRYRPRPSNCRHAPDNGFCHAPSR